MGKSKNDPTRLERTEAVTRGWSKIPDVQKKRPYDV